MELIAVGADGKLGTLNVRALDVDIGKTNDFELTFSASDWGSDFLAQADHWYAYGYAEIGGRILSIQSSTATKQVKLTGPTWRGMMEKKIIEPDAGMDYKIVSGDANDILREIIGQRFGSFFQVPSTKSGITIKSYQFKRYCTLLDGLVEMLYTQNAKLEIQYTPGHYDSGVYTAGCVYVRTVPIIDYSDTIEYSQDGKIDFTAKDYRAGVNHLICLGTGELAERQVIHLYADTSGTISKTQTIFGVDEVAAVYDYSSAESLEELEKGGIQRLRELSNYKSLKIGLNEIEAQIGDIVGGEEQITGIAMKTQITNIIVKIDTKGKLTITHKVGD